MKENLNIDWIFMKIINDTHKLENVMLMVFGVTFVLILIGAIINDVISYRLKKEQIRLIQKAIEHKVDADHVKGLINSKD